MNKDGLSKREKILIALNVADISINRLQEDCIVIVFLASEFIGNVDTISGRWGGFSSDHLLLLKNHSTIHQVPVDHIEKIKILDLKTNIVATISQF